MAFKVFEAYGAAARIEATLRLSGYLFLSKGILKRAGDEDATHAQLMFDEETDRLGIRVMKQEPASTVSGARELSIERSGASVNIVSLLRYFAFPSPKQLGKRILPVTFEEGFIVIDLRGLRSVPSPAPRPGGDLV